MTVKNSFPRVHSISTVGIIYHFNADYPFHPFRTDFTGEGGSGKTMVADMIQLILIGPSTYHSATEGNDKRPIEGMVMQPKNRQYGAGYVIMNVEVSPARYLAMGCFIEKSSKQAKMFIAQAGYDWDNRLEPLSRPVYYRDFLVDDTIVSVEELNKSLQHIHLKPLSLRAYHRLLYENEILSFDLSNKKKLDSFGSIFRSFSRGKALKTGSENLKDFLFGDSEKALMESFQQQVKSIADDYHEHDRYQNEIKKIRKKQGFIKEIVGLEEQSKLLEKDYREQKIQFWNNQFRHFSQRHGTNKLDLEMARIELACVHLRYTDLYINELQEKISTYNLTKEKLESIKESQEELDGRRDGLVGSLSLIDARISKAKEISGLIRDYGDSRSIEHLLTDEHEFVKNKALLQEFAEYLNEKNIAVEFEFSQWNGEYDKALEWFEEEQQQLSIRIKELEALSVFSDINSEQSLANWALHALNRPLSLQEESLLIYFQKLPRTEPEAITELTRYLPRPEVLFDNPEISVAAQNNGFWVELKGVLEFIPQVEKQYLDQDRRTVLELLGTLKQGLSTELADCRKKLTGLQNLKNKLHGFEQLRSALGLYKLREDFNREADPRLLISADVLKIAATDLKNLSFLEQEKRTANDTLDELIRQQQGDISVTLQRDYDDAVKYFKANNIDLSGLSTYLKDWQEKLIEYQLTLSTLQTELRKDPIEIDLIQRSMIRDINGTAVGLKIQFEKERAFDVCKTAFDNSLKDLKTSDDKLKEANNEYVTAFGDNYGLTGKNYAGTVDPELENGKQSKWTRARSEFEATYNVIVSELEDGAALKNSFHVGQLAHRLLPTVFTSARAVEASAVEALISEKLEELQRAVKEIGSRKLEILKRVFTEVHNTYREFLIKIAEINLYFNSPSKMITGGSRAALVQVPSTDYPIKWMSVFGRTLGNEGGTLDLFESLTNQTDINEMMKAAFVAEGGKKDVKIEDLLNPKSYFDLDFKLRLESGENNSGSNSQAYSGYALLGLARLALLAESKRKGIKIMPIDEAQGLGSNYEMLRKVALEEGYQILSMSIDSAGELWPGEQYIYMLSENRLNDEEGYVPAMGIFNDGEVTGNINDFIGGNVDQNT